MVFGQVVAQSQQTVGEVNVFHNGLVGGNVQLHVGEVPDTAHTAFYQHRSNLVCVEAGDAQNGNVGLQLVELYTQLADAEYGNIAQGGADDVGLDIKGGLQLKAIVVEIKMVDQRMTDVALALLTEFPKTAEVLTNLRGGQAHLAAQLAGGNAFHARITEVIQLAEIFGKTTDDVVGNFNALHMFTSI